MEEGISAEDGILQTYTYSWENHCAFASQLQQTFDKYTHKGAEFDFSVFLSGYSEVVYEPFLLMLYQLKNELTEFDGINLELLFLYNIGGAMKRIMENSF